MAQQTYTHLSSESYIPTTGIPVGLRDVVNSNAIDIEDRVSTAANGWIGTPDPSTKLDVAGDTNIDTDLTVGGDINAGGLVKGKFAGFRVSNSEGVNDYIELYAYQATGASVSTYHQKGYNRFSANYLGE